MTTNLSTQNRKSYIYLILFYDGSFYYRVRKCPRGRSPWKDTKYNGSPVTHQEKWNNTPFIKFIIEVFDNWEEALKREVELIKPNLNNPFCLNENAGGILSIEACRLGGIITSKLYKVPQSHIERLKEIRKNPKVWNNANEIYDVWIKNNRPGSYKLSKLFDGKYTHKNLERIYLKFKSGWIPNKS